MTGLLHGLSACRPRENAGLDAGGGVEEECDAVRGARFEHFPPSDQESEESEESDRNPPVSVSVAELECRV